MTVCQVFPALLDLRVSRLVAFPVGPESPAPRDCPAHQVTTAGKETEETQVSKGLLE